MAEGWWRLRLFLVAALAATTVSCQRYSPVSAGIRNGISTTEGSFSDTEHAFLKIPDAESARRNLRFITSEPHVAGTEGDWKMARFVANEFSTSGIPEVSIFDLKAALNYPRTAPQVRLVSTTETNGSGGPKILFNASLTENIEDSDETSDTPWRNHTFHGYSPSGDVTAPLVFANYGRPQDFEALEMAGVTVKDTIVLIRYGQCFRGLKVMNAQKRGALGVIIYSDPADDGFGQGDVYPKGPWRPETGVQRGSVQFISTCAGDPLRIDERYERHALQNRCGVSNYTELIPSIPSLPMSYGDAKPLLQHLDGPSALGVFGEDFDGGLNITYTVGPSATSVVHMIIDNEKTIGSIPNVIGYIPGALAETKEDMPILLGNHRDAWVYGAADPNSGTASLLEVARGLGALVKTGWQPRRSIYLLSWSGEEYGLLGSTGWAELNADSLLTQAVAYLNVDTVVSGDVLSAAATPSLATIWNAVLDDLQSSSSHSATLFANAPRVDLVDSNTNWIMNHPSLKILGSGSDYTAFLDHLGIASIDFSFGKKAATYGQYHSIYDSFSWMDVHGGRDGQPGSAFELMAYGAKIWGLLALRLAGAEVLPFDPIVQGEALGHYVDILRQNEQQRNSGKLHLALLDKAVAHFQKAAEAIMSLCGDSDLTGAPLSASSLMDEKHLQRQGTIVACNRKLGMVERRFLSDPGLPNRKWFKHVLQAPGMYLGYAAEAFPGVQYAMEMGNFTLAQEQVEVAQERITAAALFLEYGDEDTAEIVA